MSANVKELKDYVLCMRIGDTADVATSQYATNTTPAGYYFDFHSTAPAVRSLVKQGLIEAEYGWRYYKIRRIK